MGYPIAMKESVIKKVLMGSKTQCEIAMEAGIGRSTLTYWLKNYRKNGNLKLSKKEKRPQDWTAEERIRALMETGSMSDEERASWCRKNGLFVHHLEQWEKDAISSITSKPGKGKNANETRRLKKENAALRKELTRKEKALAETAALLVLKKKADSIWGVTEEE